MPSYSFTYLFSSDPQNGATNINTGGSNFSLDMSRYPLKMPNNCKNVTASVISASIPYISPNIIDPNNNYFNFFYSGSMRQIILPTGLYSLTSLASQINIQAATQGLPQNIFSFIGSTSTQKVSIIFNYATTYIDFTANNTFRNILGFDSGFYPVSLNSTVGETLTAQNVANFDTLQSYLISTNLLNNGIPVNGSISRSVIGVIPINGSPGSRLIYAPSIPTIINANELIGQARTQADFTISNQSGGSINMLNQAWNVTVQFSYDL